MNDKRKKLSFGRYSSQSIWAECNMLQSSQTVPTSVTPFKSKCALQCQWQRGRREKKKKEIKFNPQTKDKGVERNQ